MKGKAATGGCSSSKHMSEKAMESFEERLLIKDNISGIEHKILVMSGNGGVGKTAIAANIALGLSLKGKQVGLMHIDMHGPNIAKVTGLKGAPLMQPKDGAMPIQYSDNLKVMSIGFLIRNQKNAVMLRAPLNSLIKQFLTEFNWGELDYLIVDCPPGTGDELISITQLLDSVDGAIIVTAPQEVALNDVKKSICFCRRVTLPVIGIVENMSGFVCPVYGTNVNIFKSDSGEKMAAKMGVPFLGKIPIDPAMAEHSDGGKPLLQYVTESKTAAAFETVINTLLN